MHENNILLIKNADTILNQLLLANSIFTENADVFMRIFALEPLNKNMLICIFFAFPIYGKPGMKFSYKIILINNVHCLKYLYHFYNKKYYVAFDIAIIYFEI